LGNLRVWARRRKKKGININVFIAGKLKVYGDSNMLKAVIRNLTANAIKFTGKGGSVDISAEKQKKGIILTVADSGVGISEINLKKLFRSDKVNSSKGTSNETGTGIGLLLCKELVERHNGKIVVESEVDLGSKFIVFLPDKV